MPLDGHAHLVRQGWSGKGNGLRHGAITKPVTVVQKKTLAGVGKDRDEAFPFWDHVFQAASVSIQLKLHDSDNESDSEGGGSSSGTPALELKRTSTGIISNRRPTTGTSAFSGTTTPSDSLASASTSGSSTPRLNVMAAAKQQAARKLLYSMFYRGPVLATDDEKTSGEKGEDSSEARPSAASSSSSSSSSGEDSDDVDAEKESGKSKKRKAVKEKIGDADGDKRERKRRKKDRKEMKDKSIKAKGKEKAVESDDFDADQDIEESADGVLDVKATKAARKAEKAERKKRKEEKRARKEERRKRRAARKAKAKAVEPHGEAMAPPKTTDKERATGASALDLASSEPPRKLEKSERTSDSSDSPRVKKKAKKS